MHATHLTVLLSKHVSLHVTDYNLGALTLWDFSLCLRASQNSVFLKSQLFCHQSWSQSSYCVYSQMAMNSIVLFHIMYLLYCMLSCLFRWHNNYSKRFKCCVLWFSFTTGSWFQSWYWGPECCSQWSKPCVWACTDVMATVHIGWIQSKLTSVSWRGSRRRKCFVISLQEWTELSQHQLQQLAIRRWLNLLRNHSSRASWTEKHG